VAVYYIAKLSAYVVYCILFTAFRKKSRFSSCIFYDEKTVLPSSSFKLVPFYLWFLFKVKKSLLRKGMVMVAPSLNPVACWEFEGEILVLHHPTTIQVRYQAMGNLALFKIGIYQYKHC